MTEAFALHPALAAATLAVAELALCRLLLMNDSRFPWLLLVPRRARLIEITDLDAAERALLIEEVATCADLLKAASGADKLNIGAIGNRVAQLHIHVVARFADDALWPEPVWGSGPARPYAQGAATALIATLSAGLGSV